MRKYLILFFILGIIFKLWFAGLVPQPFLFDQTEYHNFAVQIVQKGLVAWQARLYGYPLFLAAIYKIFGVGNFFAVAVLQSIIDCLTGVLIFSSALKIFKSRKIAWISYLLYLFNPFTSVFVVLTLSEIWGIFLMALLIYLLLEFAEVGQTFKAPPPASLREALRAGQKTHASRLYYLLPLLLGYLPQVRPAFLFYSLVILGWLWVREIRELRVMRVVVIIILFILPFTYNIAGNWVYFRQLAIGTVDNLFVREFYISLYVPGRSPFHATSPDVFPSEVQTIYNEYTPVPQNAPERQMMAQKYLNLGLSKVFANPSDFITSRLAKFWYVWEKHFLFYYTQPENPAVDFLTYWGNNLLLFLGVSGFILWFKKGIKSGWSWFGWIVIFTIGYISLVHSISLAEERYSLPGYPLIFLFAGYGVYKLAHKFF